MDLRCNESLSPLKRDLRDSEVVRHFTELAIPPPLQRETATIERVSPPKRVEHIQHEFHNCEEKRIKPNEPTKESLAAQPKAPTLDVLISELLRVRHPLLPIGTRVWARVIGYCDWPSVIWSLSHCPRSQWSELIESYAPGKIMVLFYGERTTMWVNMGRLFAINENQINRIKNLVKWGEKNNQTQLATAALDELNYSYENADSELDRLQAPVPFFAPQDGVVHPEICAACHEFNTHVVCERCNHGWHSLCLKPPVLKKSSFKEGDTWQCQSCGAHNMAIVEKEESDDDAREETEMSGLTPDWIIHAAAYEVFLLEKPTLEVPYIKKLLDPCTNDKLNPNIPAEKLYDKNDNGLKLSNAWAGYYVILNPDYKSQVQWRFVNRAIDEVENDRVPSVILICRNSTDTAYYQRLRPYPRVLLRRQCVKFKNYENTPIGFGIVAFCIAKRNWKELYCRFLDAFSPYGEANMPIDMQTLSDPEYKELTARVHEQAAMSYRDHWMQCNACKKWRIVPYDIYTKFKDNDWYCSYLKSNTTCLTTQRKVEVMGVTYSSSNDKGFPATEADRLENQKDVIPPESHETPKTTSAVEMEEEHLMEPDISALPVHQNSSNDFATTIACFETLEKLANLPPRSNVKIMQALDVTSDSALQNRDQAISSLELARQATMAANRAYLKGLGNDPSAIHKGEVKALSAKNPLVIHAARLIAKKAAFAELELQAQKTRRHYEALKRKQHIEISRLARQLEQKKKEERDALQARQIAWDAVEELEERVKRLKDVDDSM